MKCSVVHVVIHSCLLIGAVSNADATKAKLRDVSTTPTDECIPCEILFSKLKATAGGGRAQYFEMQLRGEPKSGTGFMHEWASGMLCHACEYLRRMYGDDTCRVTWESESAESPEVSTNRVMVFEPQRGGNDARCSCKNIETVVISLSRKSKHMLPVDESCTWWHHNSVELRPNHYAACPTFRGRPVQNVTDVLGCMEEAACAITDDRPQFIVMRDPRPVIVSSYFFQKLMHNNLLSDSTLDEFVLRYLPNLCAWISIRYVLFAGLLGDQSTIFWYDDTLDQPLSFHQRFTDTIGLRLPASVVEEATNAALQGKFDFYTKGLDQHSEQDKNDASEQRSWKNEVSASSLNEMDAVLRMWLPPVLLVKLGVPLA